jgi:hypothetical protein
MRTPRALSFLLFASLAAAALFLGACASDDAAEKGENGDGEAIEDDGAMSIDTWDQFDATGLEKRRLDLNQDGKPDAYQWLKVVSSDDIQVRRKEVDINFDGKIDVVRNFNKRGDVVSEHMDMDFDGRVDVVNFFEGGAVTRKEYDTNFDSKVDIWRYFEANVVVRKEADRDFDGKIDYWEYYEDGRIDRIGVDNDGDGTADEWQRGAG